MTKQSKEDKVLQEVLRYLREQNRPYSIIDVFNNLHKEHGKTAINKVIQDLVDEGRIVEKTYGKQKVYVINQTSMKAATENEISEMDKELAKMRDELTELQNACNSLESEIKTLKSSLSTEEATAKKKELTNECEEMEKRIKVAKEAAKDVSLKEKDDIYLQLKKNVGHWRKRKRMGMDMINCILEGYPKTKQQFYEEVGLETDEEYNVSVPDLSKFNIK